MCVRVRLYRCVLNAEQNYCYKTGVRYEAIRLTVKAENIDR